MIVASKPQAKRCKLKRMNAWYGETCHCLAFRPHAHRSSKVMVAQISFASLTWTLMSLNLATKGFGGVPLRLIVRWYGVCLYGS